ncbi:hypothetical protein PUN28_018061 [Cardiocondyla obscurior]|uniref:Uncharacterized protein n=1 Tax=Cardiocondyla obscurior TaxID=286306 RepID=A0AAW2EFN0_9HYME
MAGARHKIYIQGRFTTRYANIRHTYSKRTCTETVTYARQRWGDKSAVEGLAGGLKRSRNDFPSFFLNLVRLIDAPDRNGAINLVVSISIMAILRENENGNAKEGNL